MSGVIMLTNCREPAQRKDLDHLIGAIAREMVQIKSKTGFMPRYRCSGTKFSGTEASNIFVRVTQFQFIGVNLKFSL